MADYIFYGWFTATKQGKAGLTVTCTVYGPGGTEASAQAATEIGGGLYRYTHTDATAGDYTAIFATADSTVDMQHVPALALQQIVVYLDAAVSTRSTLTAAAAADAVLDEAAAGHTGIIAVNLDAAITSRSSHSAADVWAVASRTLTSFGTLVADIWAYTTRTLTNFGTLIADIIAAISGGGSTTFTYTVTSSLTGLPVDGVSVKCTTDIAGANIVTTVTTDTFGNAVFYLDPGTYYFWCTKSGYSFTNPDTEIIS